MQINNNFWKGKKVLITGITGFKGSWLSMMLNTLGSEVYGYSLKPPTNPNLFSSAGIDKLAKLFRGDIRNLKRLVSYIGSVGPEIIFHMAAQPLVRESYRKPVETFDVNVIGTTNLLEAVRHTTSIKAVINVTTDKCYENKEWLWGYRENDALGGFDPYSSSKSCSELVTSAYRNSFFNKKEYDNHGVAIATARAGNVIGGGDWAKERLIPDLIRAVITKTDVKILAPFAIRPWQHVLEPLSGYMRLAEELIRSGPDYAEAWNFGPEDSDAKTVEWIVNTFSDLWGPGFKFSLDKNIQPHETSFLKLDSAKAHSKLGWRSKWTTEKTMLSTVDWYKTWYNKGDVVSKTIDQIYDYLKD